MTLAKPTSADLDGVVDTTVEVLGCERGRGDTALVLGDAITLAYTLMAMDMATRNPSFDALAAIGGSWELQRQVVRELLHTIARWSAGDPVTCDRLMPRK